MEYEPSFIDQLNTKSLMHHGIKGMHWGVRRFEDINGHLTSIGKRRYGHFNSDNAAKKVGKTAVKLALVGAAGYALYKNDNIDIIKNGKQLLDSYTKNKAQDNHASSIQIKKANRLASENRRKQAALDSFRQAKKSTASKIRTAIKDKTRSAIRKKAMSGVDEDDPRTWLEIPRKIKKTVNSARTIRRAVKKFRNGDRIGAATEISSEIADTTNNLINSTKKRIRKLTQYKNTSSQ